MRAPASTNANSLSIMSSSNRGACRTRLGESGLSWTVSQPSGARGTAATWPTAVGSHAISKGEASKATKGAALAATVLTIIKRTIDDVNMASIRMIDLSSLRAVQVRLLPSAPRPQLCIAAFTF